MKVPNRFKLVILGEASRVSVHRNRSELLRQFDDLIVGKKIDPQFGKFGLSVSIGPQMLKPTSGLTDTILENIQDRLSGTESFLYWSALPLPHDEIFQVIGYYMQMAAAVELYFRRIYFALRAKGANERGPERATFDQLFERLPKAVSDCALDLERKPQFLELIEKLGSLLSARNDIVHSASKFEPDGDVLIFAHANETVGKGIKTGQGIAYWVTPRTSFFARTNELTVQVDALVDLSSAWLPTLRPWLDTYAEGQLVEGKDLQDAIAKMRDKTADS